MRIKLLHHDNIVVFVQNIDEITNAATVKLFNNLHRINQREYEIVYQENKKMNKQS